MNYKIHSKKHFKQQVSVSLKNQKNFNFRFLN